MSSRAPRVAGSRRGRAIGWVAGGLFAVVIVLGLLALPLLGVPGDAAAAKADLDEALSALTDGDEGAARESVDSARSNIDAARDATQGIGGDLWNALPFVGTPVSDARHLVQALDDATSVAEIGVDLYPFVAGKDATLFRNEKVNRATLDQVIAGARQIGGHLSSAESELSEVEGSSPFVGDTISERRDEAAAAVEPLADSVADLQPMLDELPSFFGFDGQQRYLIALLNPADQRYSSGTPLAFAPMTWENGKVDVGNSLDLRPTTEQIRWPRVKGNYFHYRRPIQLRNATFAPSWSVSGEELIRAWKSANGDRYDAVLAVDVVAFARLLEVTGGFTAPGLGRLTSENLVKELVGSYDNYYPDADALDALSARVISPFKDKLFNEGDFVAKAQAIGEAAAGRHLAFYSRDPAIQEGITTLGLDGDLATPQGDYLGVFTQSVLPSKSDYWQQRRVDLDVNLDRDGAATNELQVRIHNDSPPYAVPGSDPGSGYFTRWTGFALGVFLPDGVEVESVKVPGPKWNRFVGNFLDHDFVSQNVTLEPQARTLLQASYRVPGAATVEDDGDLVYHLAMDPQGLVRAQSVSVRVKLPEGYRAVDLPDGWTTSGSSVRFQTDAFTASAQWEIQLTRGN